MNQTATVTLNGTWFLPRSTVALNGTNIAATWVNGEQLSVALPAWSTALPGNLNFTVMTPAPGGGSSVPLAYTVYIPIPNNSMVYNPVNGLFYVSVPGSAGAPYGNSVVSVDAETGALGTPIPVGSEPHRMAISSDGKTLWVGLDGASAVRQVDLTTGTAGLQFSLGQNEGTYDFPPTAYGLAALPGSPNSVAVSMMVSNDEGWIGIYDSGVLRGAITYYPYQGIFYSLLTDGTKSEVYAGTAGTYYTFTYNASGLTPLATVSSSYTYASYGSDEMQIADGVLYTDFGQAFDAESGNLLGTFYVTGTTPATGPTVADTTLGKVFILDNSQPITGQAETPNQIQVFNLSNYTSSDNAAVPVGLPAENPWDPSTYYSRLTRWGTNGLAFRGPAGVFSLRSNLVKNLSAVNADLGVTLTVSGGTTTGTNTTYTATVTNAGPSASTNVALTAQLPPTGVLVSATPSSGGCSVSGGATCDLGGLASGATATVAMVVMQTTAGSAAATVEVSGSENDPNTSNNQASSTVTVTGSMYNLAPTISAISPAAIESGSSDTIITVTGSGFGSGSSVSLGGTQLSTSYTSSTILTATVPQAQLANLGWAAITVSNPAPGGGTSNVLPLSVFSVINLGANHILYDPYSRKIMASVGSGTTSVAGNSIVAITPETAMVGAAMPIGNQPTWMALTSDGQILYTILNGSQSVARFNMLTKTAEYTYAVPPEPDPDDNSLRWIATQPGTEDTIVLDMGDFFGNAMYQFDPAAQTAAMIGEGTGGYTGSCDAFLDADDMFSFDIDTTGRTFNHFNVTSAGLTYNQFTESTLNGLLCFKLSGGLAFGIEGGVANPATTPATQIGVFPVAGAGYDTYEVAPDSSLERVFFLADTEATDVATSAPIVDGIEAFDQNTFLPSATVSLNMQSTEGTGTYWAVDLIRWGQDGLAALTSTGHIYLLRGSIVVPQLLQKNSAANLASSSTTSIPHGAGNTLLTLTGSNFVPGVTVTWNGSYRTTTIVDATDLTVAIPASDLASAGSGSLVATNPGAPASNALMVTIN